MNSSLLQEIAASIGTALVFALLAKAFPAKTFTRSAFTIKELGRKYLNWHLGLSISFIILTAVFALITWVGLKGCARFHTRLLAADVAFSPESVYWGIPALFLGMISAWVVLASLAARFMRDPFSYSEYQCYETLLYGFDSDKASRTLAAMAGAVCAVLIFLGLNCYVLLTGDHLVINRYWSLQENRYNLREIVEIRTASGFIAPNGNLVSRREFILKFKNGDEWATNFIPSDLSPATKRWFVELLSKRSGVPIKEVSIFQKDELY